MGEATDDAGRLSEEHDNDLDLVVQSQQYTYTVRRSEDDGEHVGACAGFPSLSWLATHPEKGLTGIMVLVADTISDLTAKDEPVHRPTASADASAGHPARRRLCHSGS